MKKILFFFFLFLCTNIYAATRTAVANGNWSTASTWGGTVPQAADIAVIPSGITVTLNTGVGGANTPWANPGAIKVSGKFILQGSDPYFINPCTLEVFSGGEFHDATIGNQILFTQPSYIKVYTGGKFTSNSIESIIFNGNYVAEFMLPSTTVNGAFTITVANGQVTFSASVLPLKLVSFKIRETSAGNLLYWQTSNEINTASFMIEKSNDGIHYETIGKIAASGLATNNSYNFTDNSAVNPNTFYRLRITDTDGKISYSDVIKISNGSAQSMNVYPSPAKDIIHIVTGIKGQVSIYNTEGKLVLTQQLAAGNTIIDVSKLSNGVYYIKQSGQKASFVKTDH